MGVDSNLDVSYQKRRAYDDSRSSDRDPRSSSRYGKEPAGGRHYTKKAKQEDHKSITITCIHLYHFVTIGKRLRSEYSHSDPQLTTIPVCYESNQSYYMPNPEEAVLVEGEIIQEQVLLYLLFSLFPMLYLLS